MNNGKRKDGDAELGDLSTATFGKAPMDCTQDDILGIDPGSVHGRLVVERLHFDRKELRALEFIFDPGNRVMIQSESDISRLKSVLDLASPGLDSITGLKIGINPAIRDWRLLPYMGSGIVSVSLGANRLLGGDIELPFILFLSLKDATLTVDGNPLIEDGELKL